MKKLVRYLITVDRRWLATWIIIFLGFAILDAFFPGFIGTTVIKMVGLVLCLVYAWQKFRKDNTLLIALLFTLLADTLLMLDTSSIMGVFVFCFAQFFHTIRLRKLKPSAAIFYFAVIVIVFFIAVEIGVQPMYCVAAFYAVSLFYNLYMATQWYFTEKSTASNCAMVGFMLFVVCDLLVAASYLSRTGVFPAEMARYMDYFAWIFYYPSQVLIANSSSLNFFEKS